MKTEMKIHFQKTKSSLITYRIQKKFGREEMMGDLKTVTETHSLSCKVHCTKNEVFH